MFLSECGTTYSRFAVRSACSQDIYSGWTMTMDLAMDQCLQSVARQSLDADWIVK